MPRRTRQLTLQAPRVLRTYQPTAQEFDAACEAGEFRKKDRAPRKRRSKEEQRSNPYESRIQRNTIKLLKTLLHPDAIVQAVCCEGLTPDQRLHAALMGQEPGWPDIGVHYQGREWVIEMKDRDGTRNDAQIIMHERLHRCGTPLLEECRSPEEAVAWLREHGAPFRGVISA